MGLSGLFGSVMSMGIRVARTAAAKGSLLLEMLSISLLIRSCSRRSLKLAASRARPLGNGCLSQRPPYRRARGVARACLGQEPQIEHTVICGFQHHR